jgi:sporulation protein YlmC with PRC-barrel domain
MEVSEVTGKIKTIVVEPDMDSAIAEKMVGDDKYIKVPYNAILAVNTYIVTDRKQL